MKREILVLAISTSLLSAQDTDGDGLPDSWENAHGSDPDVANASADFDRDHVTLLEEFQSSAGLSPHGRWHVEMISLPPGVTSSSSVYPITLNDRSTVLLRVRKADANGVLSYHSMLWNEGDGFLDLPKPPGANLYPRDMNDEGEVVGVRSQAGSSSTGFHFTPWSGLDILDLSGELGVTSSYLTTTPRKINNMGEIIGYQSGYGPFYLDFLGGVHSWERLGSIQSVSESIAFTDISDNGLALGIYTAFDGSSNIFTYQSELGGEGYFNYTLLESDYPPEILAAINGLDPNDLDFLMNQNDQSINEHDEFSGTYSIIDYSTYDTPAQGVFFYDGELAWNIVTPGPGEVSANAAAMNNWPHVATNHYGSGSVPHLFHDHILVSINDLPQAVQPGESPITWTSGTIFGLNNSGSVLVRGKTTTSSDDRLYLLSLDQDQDSDGLPDDWETFHAVSNPASDPDNDGLTNYEEFTLNLDPNDPGSNYTSYDPADGVVSVGIDDDGDGIPNSMEILLGLDPYDPSDAHTDLDGDGLTNLQEFGAGTSALSVDTDRDGITDFEELENQTNPNSHNPSLSLDNISGLVVLSPLFQ